MQLAISIVARSHMCPWRESYAAQYFIMVLGGEEDWRGRESAKVRKRVTEFSPDSKIQSSK